jgi:thiol:disulfide interchange protein DsbD
LGGLLGLAFVGGLILNLMPCVFPVLGIKILGFVQQAGEDRAKVKLHGLAFAVGVLVSFWVLAAVLLALRPATGGAQQGWGFQLQNPGFVFALAVVMLTFGLSLSGVFEIGGSLIGAGSALQAKRGLTGSFFSGVLATVVATPCSAPFLGVALAGALALPALQSMVVFSAIAVGLAAPYLLLSIFPQFIKVLPRPGAWMETFKQFMAFPLYATAGFLLWVLAAQLRDDYFGFLFALLALAVIALAVWIFGRWAVPHRTRGVRRTAIGVAALLFAGGCFLGWPKAAVGGSSSAGVSGADAIPHPEWQPWSAEAVTKLRGEGRIIYVDFTARWCVTCQVNKGVVFSSAEVLRTFHERKVATLRADWTNQDSAITAELQRFHRAAVPMTLVYLPGRTEPLLLPEVLTPGTVLDAVRAAR